jgi:hypothetical protein
MPNVKTAWIWVLTFGGFIGWLVGILGFCGVDARKVAQIMTAHYLFLLLTVVCFAGFVWGLYLSWRSWWESSHVTNKNVEQKIRQWIDTLRHGTLKDDKSHFAFFAEPHRDVPVEIKRLKDRPTYLELKSRVTTTDKQRVALVKMTEEKRRSVLRALQLECSRSKIRSHWDDKKLDFVCIHKSILITPDLTEARFIDGLTEMGFGSLVVFNTLAEIITSPL